MQIWVDFGTKSCQIATDSATKVIQLTQLAINHIFNDLDQPPDYLDFELYFRKKKLNSTNLVKGLVPDGSKIQLVREPCGMVDVALIFENQRMISKLNAKSTLWQVLITCGSSYQLDFVTKTSGEKYLMPVMVYMNRQVH